MLGCVYLTPLNVQYVQVPNTNTGFSLLFYTIGSVNRTLETTTDTAGLNRTINSSFGR